MIKGLQVLSRRLLGLKDLDELMDLAVYGSPTASGVSVSEVSAMRLPSVWACVDLIRKAGSVLPGNVFRRIANGVKPHEIATGHYLQPIVNRAVNPWMSANEWRSLAIVDYLTWGNHYTWIEWGDNNRPVALWPISPARVTAERVGAVDSPIRYYVQDAGGKQHEFPSYSILHFRGMSTNGVTGLSPIGMMREAIGLVGAAQQSIASLHKNGMTSRLILTHPQSMDEGQVSALRKSFNEAYSGVQNAHKAIILQGGMTAQPFSISPVDAQFVELARLSDSQIYKAFGVPPHMVGDTDKATSWGSGIEQLSIGFVTYTVLPIVNALENVMEMALMPDSQKSHFIEFELKGLLRGDTAARAQWHRTMVELGVSSPNDVRRYENEDPYPGGDVYRRPLNHAFVNPNGEVVLSTGSEKEDKGNE